MLHADLHTLSFVERGAAEGVGDECGSGQSVCTVKLHAVGHPGLPWLKTQQQHQHLDCL